jgi:hypothetical protein
MNDRGGDLASFAQCSFHVLASACLDNVIKELDANLDWIHVGNAVTHIVGTAVSTRPFALVLPVGYQESDYLHSVLARPTVPAGLVP